MALSTDLTPVDPAAKTAQSELINQILADQKKTVSLSRMLNRMGQGNSYDLKPEPSKSWHDGAAKAASLFFGNRNQRMDLNNQQAAMAQQAELQRSIVQQAALEKQQAAEAAATEKKNRVGYLTGLGLTPEYAAQLANSDKGFQTYIDEIGKVAAKAASVGETAGVLSSTQGATPTVGPNGQQIDISIPMQQAYNFAGQNTPPTIANQDLNNLKVPKAVNELRQQGQQLQLGRVNIQKGAQDLTEGQQAMALKAREDARQAAEAEQRRANFEQQQQQENARARLFEELKSRYAMMKNKDSEEAKLLEQQIIYLGTGKNLPSGGKR